MSRKNTGDNIEATNAGWDFALAAENFDGHVKKSIPLYELGHEYVAELASFYLRDNAIVYEIGCSTGVMSEKILLHNADKKYSYIAIDNTPAMVEKAKSRLKKDKRAKIILSDVVGYSYEPCCLFLSYYTIQFTNPAVRQELVNKIYNSLEWGGAAIIFEKVRGADARFQDILTQLYIDYKLKQGFDESEIIHKSRSLKGVLEPFSTAGNMDLFKRAGFVDVMTIFRYLCFEGYLCIK